MCQRCVSVIFGDNECGETLRAAKVEDRAGEASVDVLLRNLVRTGERAGVIPPLGVAVAILQLKLCT